MSDLGNNFGPAHSPQTQLLIYSVLHNKPNLAQTALRFGANAHVRDQFNNNLLHLCLDENMGAILIRGGTKVNERNNEQQTPLITAMHKGIIPLSILLINNNSDVNAQQLDGKAPLHLAESDEVNDALLNLGAYVDMQDNEGDTPLHLAIRIKGSPIVTALRQFGASTDIKNNAGNTPTNEFELLVIRREKELVKIANALFTSDNSNVANPTVTASFPAFALHKQSLQTTAITARPERVMAKLRP